jgi:hypothetical protein
MIETDISILKGNPDLVSRNPELQESKAKKRSKYNNIRTEYNGRWYDSKREALHAMKLDVDLLEGKIVAWIPQVTFRLPGCTYRADFVVLLEKDWRVDDAKGMKTAVYKLKKRLFKEKYGRDIVEV